MNMKTKHILSLVWILTAVMALTACNDWLDVEPKSQIKENKQFSREGGYKDQLTGVYTAMATPQMYGQNMGIQRQMALRQQLRLYTVNKQKHDRCHLAQHL